MYISTRLASVNVFQCVQLGVSPEEIHLVTRAGTGCGDSGAALMVAGDETMEDQLKYFESMNAKYYYESNHRPVRFRFGDGKIDIAEPVKEREGKLTMPHAEVR